MHPSELSIDTFQYELPEHRIAKFPLPERDQSKLLVYERGKIEDCRFNELPHLLDAGDLLMLNNTRVIPARIILHKPTGGAIEVFCLDPIGSSHQDAMSAASGIRWKCLVGGVKKWKDNQPIGVQMEHAGRTVQGYAAPVARLNDAFMIEFTWDHPTMVFSEFLEAVGKIPLPPYFNRDVELSDLERYQTVFSKYKGSVAAPTASLHFTTSVFDRLKARGVIIDELTLHVGAGTFKPVSSETLQGHEMHSEWFSVSRNTIVKLRRREFKRLVAAGTTCLRTIESLYGLGVQRLRGADWKEMPSLSQWEIYDYTNEAISLNDALDALLNYLDETGSDFLHATSALLIAPSFRFRLADGLITNFHQPKSTLMVLVAGVIGDDWKTVYRHALDNDYRFLSYGDSSLLWRV
ncbi:MAG: S-adenosylmethionine:tRNA ribosyltransferase-isomerase [Flavobacteriales bacterium]